MPFVVAGLYVPGDWGWRFPSVLQALGPIMILIVTWFCPESPRVSPTPSKRAPALRSRAPGNLMTDPSTRSGYSNKAAWNKRTQC